ncbi:MAG: chemotaxis protein MotB [Pseudomonadota bacterium]
MAALLVIFILAAVMLIIELRTRKEEIDDAIREIQETSLLREKIIEEIVSELAKRNIKVIVSEDKKVLRISEDVLAFETLQYRIPEVQLNVVHQIGHVVLDRISVQKRFNFIDTIFIEGHTDSRGAPRFMRGLGNWGLSTARATSVWKFWSSTDDYGEALKALRNQRGEPMFSVSGYSDTRPLIQIDDTPAKQRANRRIDIRFSMRTPALNDYEVIRQALDR